MRACSRFLLFLMLPAVILFAASTTTVQAQEKCVDELKCISFITEVDDWFNLEQREEGRGIPSAINGIIRLAFSVSSVLLVLYIAWYGTALIYQQMAGDILSAGKAKSNVKGAIYGISVLLCSYIILDFFVPSLLKEQDFLQEEYNEVFEGNTSGELTFLRYPVYDCGSDLSDKVIDDFFAWSSLSIGYGTESPNKEYPNVPKYPALDELIFSLKTRPSGEIDIYNLDGRTCTSERLRDSDYSLDIKLLYSSSQANPPIGVMDVGEFVGADVRGIDDFILVQSADPTPNISREVFAVVVLTINGEPYRSRLYGTDLRFSSDVNVSSSRNRRLVKISDRRADSCDRDGGLIKKAIELFGLEYHEATTYITTRSAADFINVMGALPWDDCEIEITG